MCGRYTLTASMDTLTETFPQFKFPDGLSPQYNITPTQSVVAVPNDGEGKANFLHWGLIPSWAKEPDIGNRMINARAETLSEKPSFRTAYRRRRCLILADGYYEWRQEPDKKAKTPIYIRLKSEETFAFAGLWERWQPKDSEAESAILSCTIITTTPNSLLEKIHHRMPVILDRRDYDQWLDPSEQSPDKLNHLLKPYPDSNITAYPVSRMVNNPRNNSPECIAPAVG